MRNKIRAGIIGAAMIAATVAPVTAASAQTAHVAAAAPYCSPLAQWSGYGPFLWWLIGGRC